MTLNKVQLIGRLGKDPEVRRLNGGDRVVSFSLATSDRWRNKDGERQERTEWHNVVIYNDKLGEVAEEYLRKGSQCYVEGKLQTRKWEKDGVERYTTEVVLQRFGGDIKLLGSKDENRDSHDRDDFAARKSGEVRGNVQRGTASLSTRDPFELDDIPF